MSYLFINWEMFFYTTQARFTGKTSGTFGKDTLPLPPLSSSNISFLHQPLSHFGFLSPFPSVPLTHNCSSPHFCFPFNLPIFSLPL